MAGTLCSHKNDRRKMDKACNQHSGYLAELTATENRQRQARMQALLARRRPGPLREIMAKNILMELNGVDKSFRSADGAPRVILDDVNFPLAKGESVAHVATRWGR